MNLNQIKNLLTVVSESEESYGSGDKEEAVNALIEEAYRTGYNDSEEGRSRQVQG